MKRDESLRTAARVGAVVAVAALTLALLALLPRPGYRTSRLLLFAAMAGTGWVGAFGVVTDRVALAIGGAVGLFALGFWQFTVGLFALPVGLVLLAAAAVVAATRREPVE